MRYVLFVCVFALPLLIASGCGKATPPAVKPSAPVNPPRSTDEVTLTEGTLEDVDRAAKDTVKAVVVVEFWTLATEPKTDLALAADSRAGGGGGVQEKREPTLSKDKVAWHGIRKAQYMAHKYDGYFLRVISVNVDSPDKKEEVMKHLKNLNARHVTNFTLKGDPSKFTERYGYSGKVPHQIVFGRNGSKVWATGDPLPYTFDDILFTELSK